MFDQPPPNLHQRMQMTLAWVLLVVRMLIAPVVVWTRRGFGDSYFGFPAFFALVFIPLWGTFFPDASPLPLMVFWFGYIAMLAVARYGMFRRWLRGEIEHRLYNGYSRLHRLFPNMDETTMKATVEPAAVFITGLLLLAISQPVGMYLAFAAIGIAIDTRIITMQERARLLDLTDAAIEQRQLTEQFRSVFR